MTVVRRGAAAGLRRAESRRRRSHLPVRTVIAEAAEALLATLNRRLGQHQGGGGVKAQTLCYSRFMTRDEIIGKIKETAPALRAEGVAHLCLYGSRARGDAREDSDLDVLIDIDPQAKLYGLDLVGVIADVERAVTAATGIPTQAAMRRSLEPRFADRIADDLIEIF